MSAKHDDLNGWPAPAERYDLWGSDVSWTAIIHSADLAHARHNSANSRADNVWDWHILDLLLKKYGLV